MKFSGKQVAAARELLGITQPELATSAGVGLNTVVRFETGQGEPYQASLEKIQAELERRGIEFTNGNSPPPEGEGFGVRLNLTKAAAYARVEKGSAK